MEDLVKAAEQEEDELAATMADDIFVEMGRFEIWGKMEDDDCDINMVCVYWVRNVVELDTLIATRLLLLLTTN